MRRIVNVQFFFQKKKTISPFLLNVREFVPCRPFASLHLRHLHLVTGPLVT